MTHFAGFLMLFLALVVHEAGHAIAMMRRGVDIEEAGIGLPVKGLTFRLRLPFVPFPIALSPLLIAAYVKPSRRGELDLRMMSRKDQVVCYGAGIVMNLVFGGVLLILLLLSMNPFGSRRATIVFTIVTGLTLAFVLLRRVLPFVMPVIGVAMLVVAVALVLNAPESVGGPIAVVTTAFGASSWFGVVLFGASMLLNLGLINMVPFVPADGGRITCIFLESRGWVKLSEMYARLTSYALATLIVVLLAKDIISF